MKKLSYLLIAAFATLAVASCVKDQIETVPQEGSVGQTEFTVALAPETRTDLVEGKTVWVEGDEIWVSNGAASETITVPEDADGQSSFSFKTTVTTPTADNPTIYVVYPAASAKGLADGVVTVDVPSVQDGMFQTANVCAGKSFLGTIEMRNVTGVLKVNVPETVVEPVYQLVFSGVEGTALTGTCTVDFTGIDPVVKAATASASLTVQAGGEVGDFYAAVIPGTYAAGFKMTAATVNFEHASETKVSTVANTVKINQIVDLGTIGTDLKPLQGDGSAASPYLVENLGHMIAIATAVDNGEESNSFAGKFFKLTEDISGVTLPIGFNNLSSTPKEGEVNHPFCGDFDGNNHTITIDINGSVMSYPHRIGLFGALNSGASIHDLTVAGKIVSTNGEAIGAIVGRVDVPDNGTPVKLTNLKNEASVTAKGYAGGVLGYAVDALVSEGSLTLKDCVNKGTVTGTTSCLGGVVGYLSGKNVSGKYSIVLDHCVNEGAVQGGTRVGGVSGYSYYTDFKGCTNNAKVTGTATGDGFFYMTYNSKGSLTYGNRGSGINGVGGILGASQNCLLTSCANEGTVKGVNKVGGVMGTLYWSKMEDCTNAGPVSATAAESVVGGLVGYSHCSYYVTDSVNEGDVNGVSIVGGIVGYATGTYYGHSSAMAFNVSKCTNLGKVTAENGVVGGICGVQVNSQSPSQANVYDCVNEGEVFTEGYKAGGITAVMACCTGWSSFEINRCVNNGKVTAKKWVGGVVGNVSSAQDYWKADKVQNLGNAKNRWNIYNSVNNGAILGTGTEEDKGEFVGGIVGFNFSTSGAEANNLGLFISNCLNTGDVMYEDNTHKNVFCGGIVGNFLRGRIYNVCNTGRVGPKSGSPAEGSDVSMGAVIGKYDDGQARYLALQEAYYLVGTCGQDMGTASVKVANENNIKNVTSFDADGTLSAEVEYNGEKFVNCLEALNAWVTKSGKWDPEKGSGYFEWVAGPAFKQY